MAPELLGPGANAMRLALHPRGVAPRIESLAEWRAGFANWIDRPEAEALLTHDGEKAIIRAARRRVRDLSSDGFLAVRDEGARERLIAAVA